MLKRHTSTLEINAFYAFAGRFFRMLFSSAQASVQKAYGLSVRQKHQHKIPWIPAYSDWRAMKPVLYELGAPLLQQPA